MFKTYGFIGVLLIVLVELNYFFKIEPFASWYFPIVWLGYILTLDALIYKIRKNSLLSNRPWKLLGMAIISALFWWIFEFMNMNVTNWIYSDLPQTTIMNFYGSIAFATVLPAFFETIELIRTLHLFDHKKLKKKHNITKKFLHSMMGIGVITFLLPLILPTYFYPLVWVTFFFLLDPINYLHKQPSIIQHLKDKKLVIPLSLLLAGIIMGFFWEFWNYWAVPKWSYDVPFVGFFKIFEMPILGYLGYFPFAFELYAMYFFVRSLFLKQEKLLVH
jgi:hypothetical protein